jgi:hypothetical protein
MPFERGGLADKLGNRYEGRYVVKQLLLLLNEDVHSVTIEDIGDDEYGVDLWVEQKDGSKEAYQCKARNASKDNWSISDLLHRSVLQKLKFQLDRDSTYRFALISSVGSIPFQDMCNFARRSADSATDFYENKIKKASAKVQKYFHQFCESYKLDPNDNRDLLRVFDYLKRSEIRVYPDDVGSYRELLGDINRLLVSPGRDSDSLYVTLASYGEIKERWASAIHVDELRQYLTNNGIQLKRLDHDARIAPAIQNLQNEFIQSIQPLLINGGIIGRTETDSLLENIESGKNIILCGSAGIGKSGVLFELIKQFQVRNIPFLPLRLDRRMPDKNARHFGIDLGLPDCPVYSLNALAQSRHCVLILDQLDAVRWTNAHANASLEVCKEMVNHVRSLKTLGKQVSVVLSCRTFDLEHDPSIKGWLVAEKDFVKIEVKELDDRKLKEIVGTNFETMPHKEKKLLSCPQNLYIWMHLRGAGILASFQNATTLMREFFKERRLKIYRERGIDSKHLEDVLSTLVDNMEKNGWISAPELVVSKFPSIIEALCSYGIIQNYSQTISFCHQRYLDYLIAARLLEMIYSGKDDVIAWLGEKERQTLFRREQLRQALSMLCEDDDKFLKAVKEILESEDIRFHIKHLVLEVIGAQDRVSLKLSEYCFQLFNDPFWQAHILETVYRRHRPHVQYLLNIGMLFQWLSGKDEDKSTQCLWILRTVSDLMPDEVSSLLEPFSDDPTWFTRILDTICWDISDDSDRMFELHLKLYKQGAVRDFINWKTLCLKSPLRAIRIIETVLSTWNTENLPMGKRSRIESWYDQDEKLLNEVARMFPKETWDRLVPHIERLTKDESQDKEFTHSEWKKDRYERHGSTNLERGVALLVIVAGRQMAASSPQELIDRVHALQDSQSLIIQEIITESYVALPNQHADEGILWLLHDPKYLRVDHSCHQSKWGAVVNLVEATSPFCSFALFKELEQLIYYYHAPDEKHNAKVYLNHWRKGYSGHYWGEAQYFLLPALDEQRSSILTRNLIKVLQRKFDGYSFDRSGSISGGMIGSKLDRNLAKISDQAWLKIVGNRTLKKDFSGKWDQVDENHALESSVRQFSSSLGKIARRNPERFAQLALSFPDGVDPLYVAAIFDACSATSPDSNMPEKEKLSWRPATVETIEKLFKRFQAGDDRSTAYSFLRLILSRAEETWSDDALQRLIHYAQHHPDPEPGELNVRRLDREDGQYITVDDLLQNSINCVRGTAAQAIAGLLWKQQELIKKLRPAIESLINNPNPVVRMASLEVVLPMLNIDRKQAVEWFRVICCDDLRIAASPYAQRFFNYTIQEYLKELAPIIKNMSVAPFEDVSKAGASEITARWLSYGFFEEELKVCLTGTIPQRRGVADVAAHFLKDTEYSVKCQELLRPLLNDPEKEVRNELHAICHDVDINEQTKPFLIEYIKSQSFREGAGYFVHWLKEKEGSIVFLADIILSLHEAFSLSFKKESENPGTYVSYTISESFSLLLRLYDQATQERNADIVSRTLDVIDALYESRVGVITNLSKAIEQT